MKSKDRGGDAKRRRKDEAPVIDDPRFAGLHSDPRFQKLPKSRLRLPLDPRFQRMFTDKAFVDPFSLDKRGRPVKKKEKKKHTLERYYRIDDAAAATPAPEEGLKDKEGSVDVEEDGGVEKNAALKEASDSDDDGASESSSSESSSSDADDSGEEEEEEEEEEKVATTDKETRRLAVVNMDWSCIKALDLLMVFNSFLPKGGSIASVAVYPSQFGLEQMKKEEVHGPALFNSKQDDDQEDELDMEKLRAYEKSKLRYYFAVVTCDSVSTASALYTACDGIEFERTSNILDLQFVPDDREFTVEPRDVASQIEEGYEAPDFQTAALQLSNVKLTWDDDEPVRAKSLRKKFDPDELKEMDFKAYLASEDEDEDDESRREKFRSLLLDNPDEAPDSKKKKDVDMEITFPSGLEELNKKYLERNKKNRDEKEETVWEAQLRRKKEKGVDRKKKEKHDETEEKTAIAADEDGFNDPFFESDPEREADDASESEDEKIVPRKVDKDERKKNREERELKKKEDERRKAELELLLLDENGGKGGVKGYNLKKGKKRSKAKAKESDAKNEELLAKTDFNDPRFSALFNSHHFAIDPTDPQFKRSATKLRAIAEMQQKRFQGQAPGDEPKPRERKEKLELSSLVRSLKRKAAAT
ncbi:pre-rRNA-processing protein esf1 [Selaginella moellendorffii]|uniref:pre-rRNA-processing protein esf1 n=1 Tax=Selaginella moellendorffii TaxID=88036 RepID=UPI000D1CD6AA|nr:pre-rRNA-processing protein esf1 [Selaginella moellendorffii]|eukprot:XP_024542740.1 pre-rRNA-processing protein esf1 [Selaginella moellendorffii]